MHSIMPECTSYARVSGSLATGSGKNKSGDNARRSGHNQHFFRENREEIQEEQQPRAACEGASTAAKNIYEGKTIARSMEENA